MSKSIPHIVYIPSWYPSELDVQNGVFIQKHAQAAALNNKVSVLFAYAAKKTSEEHTKNGNLSEHILTFKKSNNSWINKFRLLKYYFKQYKQLKNVDIIHAHVWSNKAILAYLLSILYRKPLVISEHWSGYRNQFGFIESLLMRIVFKRARFILPVSKFLQSLMEMKGIQGHYKVIGNIIESSEKTATPSGSFKFLMVADLRDEIKNISAVIHAFQELNIESCSLNIIGDGPDKEYLQSIAKSENIHFLGGMYNKAVLKEIPKHHAVIINSRIETFSVVALESLAAGRPVIYTKCGGPEELVPQGFGIQISIDNLTELKNAILQMKSSYSSFTSKELQKSVSPFSQRNISQLLTEIYSTILNK